MVKSRFVTEYDDPEYTVGLGGSGGAIQQYVYGQNYLGLLDGAIPQYSYPDMATQTIHIGDCELLERWMDYTGASESPLQVAGLEQPLVARGPGDLGHDCEPVPAADAVARRPGSTSASGAGGLAAGPQPGSARCPGSHARAASAGGVDALGRRRQRLRAPGRERFRPPHVGQRRRPVRPRGAGRRAHRPCRVPRPERHDRRVEGVEGHGPGGLPVRHERVPGRHRRLERPERQPGRGERHRPRTEGSVEAMRAACNSGLVFDGKIDYQSSTGATTSTASSTCTTRAVVRRPRSPARARRRRVEPGDLVHRCSARPRVRPDADGADHGSMAREHPKRILRSASPGTSRPGCGRPVATNGTPIYAGSDAWNGILGGGALGPCASVFEIHGTSHRGGRAVRRGALQVQAPAGGQPRRSVAVSRLPGTRANPSAPAR